MGQTFLRGAARSASSPERLDPLELWRIADRAARHAEIRVSQAAAALLLAGMPTPETQEAVLLRQKANELLRAALGDFDGSVRELQHTAQTLRT